MQLLTDAGAEPGDSQAAISALADKFNPRKLKIGQEITMTFERNDADSYRLFEMSLNPSIEREVNVTRVADNVHANEPIREFNTGVESIDGQSSEGRRVGKECVI